MQRDCRTMFPTYIYSGESWNLDLPLQCQYPLSFIFGKMWAPPPYHLIKKSSLTRKSIYDSCLLKSFHVSGQVSLFPSFHFFFFSCFQPWERKTEKFTRGLMYVKTWLEVPVSSRSERTSAVQKSRWMFPPSFLFGRAMAQNRSNCFSFTF